MVRNVERLAAWRRSRALGVAVIALGAIAVVSPFWSGEWALALLGAVVFGSAAIELVRTLAAGDVRRAEARYLESVVMLLVGLVFFYSPALVLRGVVALFGVLLVADGAMKLASVARRDATGRAWDLLNGAVHAALGVVLVLYRASLGPAALGLVVGVWLISLGWEVVFRERDGATGEPAEFAPGARLGLADHPEFQRFSRSALDRESDRLVVDLRWCIGLAVVFFAIHIGRMDLRWNLFGAVSTAVAVVGDLLFAIVLAVVLVLPARLVWRRLTRGVERSAWRRRIHRGAGSAALGDRVAERWLDGRLQFDARLHRMRGSFATALARVVQIGLPLTVLLVAINPIWGFSWFFNTENWVSGFWQKIVELRVDPWREAMVDAVVAGAGAGSSAEPGLFEVRPDGVAGASDFSFLVLGDTGEGDASQHSLRDRFLVESRRDDVKFLVVSSDVIYPAGAMKDYEFNFYLPFKGVEKPIYAIPGNHDWFGALDAFNANFLEPGAARAAIRARLDADLLLTRSAADRVDWMVDEADRLRREYRVRNGFQRAPFFELHAGAFSLVAVDTGVLRRLDGRERAWLESALERARGRFTMVVLGHPFYAGGHDQRAFDADFAELHALLARYEVPIVMAGDTHDFEYYRETYATADEANEMHHFVNGGGGAYLSIGTALDWPEEPPVADWAYYPSTAAVRAKLERETPTWKRPFWWWLNAGGGWPGSVEGLSGAFDFNRAPFLQSYVEVRVEGSAGRVRLILHGVHGGIL